VEPDEQGHSGSHSSDNHQPQGKAENNMHNEARSSCEKDCTSQVVPPAKVHCGVRGIVGPITTRTALNGHPNRRPEPYRNESFFLQSSHTLYLRAAPPFKRPAHWDDAKGLCVTAALFPVAVAD
jgi:hypothetical protein